MAINTGLKGDLNSTIIAGWSRSDIVMFGHTHVPCCEKIGDLADKPRSISRPRLTRLAGIFVWA